MLRAGVGEQKLDRNTELRDSGNKECFTAEALREWRIPKVIIQVKHDALSQ